LIASAFGKKGGARLSLARGYLIIRQGFPLAADNAAFSEDAPAGRTYWRMVVSRAWDLRLTRGEEPTVEAAFGCKDWSGMASVAHLPFETIDCLGASRADAPGHARDGR